MVGYEESRIDIDKVYIDGPCEFLIRRSVAKLLAEHFLQSENSRAQSYFKQFSWEIPELNHTAYTPVLLVASRDNRPIGLLSLVASKTPANVLEPHAPSIYTLSLRIEQSFSYWKSQA